MLEGCKSAKERWGGVSELIDNWLNERQGLIVLYCSISGIEPQNDDDRSLQEKLRDFCQLLVDYVSAGHFEVYEQLLQEARAFNNEEALERSDALFPKIQKNTEACLDFNDNSESLGNIATLQSTISGIGETLEERFSLEDQLIEILHNSHRDLVNTGAEAS